jgi:hypothetical protein
MLSGFGDDIIVFFATLITIVGTLFLFSFCRTKLSSVGSSPKVVKPLRKPESAKNNRTVQVPQDLLECPICMSLLENACETSCSHAYCAGCIMEYWKRNGKHQAVQCPLDRTPVRFLVPSNTIRSQCEYLSPKQPEVSFLFVLFIHRTHSDENLYFFEQEVERCRELDREIAEYNQRFSGETVNLFGFLFHYYHKLRNLL